MIPEDCPSLNLRGQDSPVLPLLVRRALARQAQGQTLEVRLSSAQWARDLPCIVERCLALEDLPGGWRLLIRRGEAELASNPEPCREA